MTLHCPGLCDLAQVPGQWASHWQPAAPWGWQIPVGMADPRGRTAPCRGLSHPEKDKEGQVSSCSQFSPQFSFGGLALSQRFNSAEEERKAAALPEQPPHLSLSISQQFGPRNVTVGTSVASQPACEWVPGTSDSRHSSDRRQPLRLVPGRGHVGGWQGKGLASVGTQGQGGDRDGTGGLRTQERQILLPCPGNGSWGG